MRLNLIVVTVVLIFLQITDFIEAFKYKDKGSKNNKKNHALREKRTNSKNYRDEKEMPEQFMLQREIVETNTTADETSFKTTDFSNDIPNSTRGETFIPCRENRVLNKIMQKKNKKNLEVEKILADPPKKLIKAVIDTIKKRNKKENVFQGLPAKLMKKYYHELSSEQHKKKETEEKEIEENEQEKKENEGKKIQEEEKSEEKDLEEKEQKEKESDEKELEEKEPKEDESEKKELEEEKSEKKELEEKEQEEEKGEGKKLEEKEQKEEESEKKELEEKEQEEEKSEGKELEEKEQEEEKIEGKELKEKEQKEEESEKKELEEKEQEEEKSEGKELEEMEQKEEEESEEKELEEKEQKEEEIELEEKEGEDEETEKTDKSDDNSKETVSNKLEDNHEDSNEKLENKKLESNSNENKDDKNLKETKSEEEETVEAEKEDHKKLVKDEINDHESQGREDNKSKKYSVQVKNNNHRQPKDFKTKYDYYYYDDDFFDSLFYKNERGHKQEEEKEIVDEGKEGHKPKDFDHLNEKAPNEVQNTDEMKDEKISDGTPEQGGYDNSEINEEAFEKETTPEKKTTKRNSLDKKSNSKYPKENIFYRILSSNINKTPKKKFQAKDNKRKPELGKRMLEPDWLREESLEDIENEFEHPPYRFDSKYSLIPLNILLSQIKKYAEMTSFQPIIKNFIEDLLKEDKTESENFIQILNFLLEKKKNLKETTPSSLTESFSSRTEKKNDREPTVSNSAPLITRSNKNGHFYQPLQELINKMPLYWDDTSYTKNKNPKLDIPMWDGKVNDDLHALSDFLRFYNVWSKMKLKLGRNNEDEVLRNTYIDYILHGHPRNNQDFFLDKHNTPLRPYNNLWSTRSQKEKKNKRTLPSIQDSKMGIRISNLEAPRSVKHKPPKMKPNNSPESETRSLNGNQISKIKTKKSVKNTNRKSDSYVPTFRVYEYKPEERVNEAPKRPKIKVIRKKKRLRRPKHLKNSFVNLYRVEKVTTRNVPEVTFPPPKLKKQFKKPKTTFRVENSVVEDSGPETGRPTIRCKVVTKASLAGLKGQIGSSKGYTYSEHPLNDQKALLCHSESSEEYRPNKDVYVKQAVSGTNVITYDDPTKYLQGGHKPNRENIDVGSGSSSSLNEASAKNESVSVITTNSEKANSMSKSETKFNYDDNNKAIESQADNEGSMDVNPNKKPLVVTTKQQRLAMVVQNPDEYMENLPPVEGNEKLQSYSRYNKKEDFDIDFRRIPLKYQRRRT